MSSIGTGYDQECLTLSPDGRIFQVEYAAKAADNSGTALGLRCKDGVIIAVDKPIPSATMLSSSNRRVHNIAPHIGMTCAGLLSDSRYVLNQMRQESASHKEIWDASIPVRTLADKMGEFVHIFTFNANYRPLGCSLLVAGTDGEEFGDDCRPQLYSVDPTGMVRGYYATAIGRNKQNVRTELEKVAGPGREIACDEDAVKRLVKVLVDARDSGKKESAEGAGARWQIEMMWISKKTAWKCVRVPEDIIERAVAETQEANNPDDEL